MYEDDDFIDCDLCAGVDDSEPYPYPYPHCCACGADGSSAMPDCTCP
ncbi:hypothetical protein [Streptomyces sp. NBC_00829]|nr:hypothetical protein OG293_18140 [Streptomyces sp. NBC_00829]